MNLLGRLGISIALIHVLGNIGSAHAALIEFDLQYELSSAPIFNDPNVADGQILGGVGTFFPDEAFVLGVGDTLIFNIFFDVSLQVFDFGDPTYETFSFGLNTAPGTPSFNGTWTSSIEALGAVGNIWSGPYTSNWAGGGGGFGVGSGGVDVTSSQGIFSGIRWITTITSASTGDPMTLVAFTGVQLNADKVRILPTKVPEPGTLALFGIGLFGMELSRRRRKV